ncbi:MAG: hypothetical protein J6Q89_01750 [Clostridia bacterium]|nr:hypothetical protein [Clostridia bacterium]
MKTKYLSFLLAIVFSLFITVTAAAEPIDLDKKGSIAISMQDDGKTIESGSFTIFKTADIWWNVDKYDFEYADAFAKCGIGFEKLDSLNTAKSYVDYIERNSIEGTKVEVGEYGTAIFTDLSTGLYLVMQEDSADGYEKCEPFFVTLPINGEEGWVYEIDASPKINIEQESNPPPSNIPQTGQLKWPIPVLAVLGVLVFSVGCVLVS